MAKTKLKLGMTVLVIACAASILVIQRQPHAKLREEIGALRERIAQLEAENESLSNRLARTKSPRSPRLPAPPMQATAAPTNSPTDDLQSTNVYGRFMEHPPKLTAAQIETYLKANGSNAPSLLAAYRTSGDPALLQEAMQQHPNDPRVAFEAVFAKDLPPEQQRQWLDAFKQTAPDNALANYLSARSYFNAGQTDQAVQELLAASGKQLNDYTLDREQNDEEAYLSAGYSAAEAKRASDSWLELPQLAQEKQLGRDVVALASAYNQSGEQASAQAALQMAMNLGQNVANDSSSAALISQLVGTAIKKITLSAMDPNGPYGANAQTVQDQLNQLTQQRTAISGLVDQATPFLPKLSDQDMLNYENRRRAFGEETALRWVLGKFGQQ